MSSTYTAALPPGWILAKVRDQEWKGSEAGMPRPDARHVDDAVTFISWSYFDNRVIPDGVVAAWRAAVADPTPPASAPWAVADQQESQISNQLAGLRTYLGLSSPSAAQRLAMEKALIRVVLNLVRQARQDVSGTD